MIEFHLDQRSGLSPYLQLVRQVRQALRLGLLREGDQLPTVKEVVGRLAINPNTVLKAYRELEHDGLVAARRPAEPMAKPTMCAPLMSVAHDWVPPERVPRCSGAASPACQMAARGS